MAASEAEVSNLVSLTVTVSVSTRCSEEGRLHSDPHPLQPRRHQLARPEGGRAEGPREGDEADGGHRQALQRGQAEGEVISGVLHFGCCIKLLVLISSAVAQR